MSRFKYTIFALAAATLCSSCTTPYSSSGSTHPYITSGQKFGVAIGMDRTEARMILENRGETFYTSTKNCEDIHLADKCPEGAVVDSYLVHKLFQNGVIRVVIVNEQVVAISWILDARPDL